MARTSKRVSNYTPHQKGSCITAMDAFYKVEECLNTLFDIRCETKKKWGCEWYDLARYGYYAEARKQLISKPACMSKTVALKCIKDLEVLRNELKTLEGRGC